MRKNIENQNNYDKDKNIIAKQISSETLTALGLDQIDLPTGYVLMGGAARSALFATIFPSLTPPKIRDLDIGTLANADPSFSDEISEKYMHDDYMYGHGVQEIGDVAEYMNSRDFTMNQVLLNGDELITTKRAIDDVRRGIIRFAEYSESWDNDRLKFATDRLRLKAELQKVVLGDQGFRMSIDSELDVDDYENYFNLALFMQKSFEYGGTIPEKFIGALRDGGYFSDEVLSGGPMDVIEQIDKLISFDWRNEAKNAISSHNLDREMDREKNHLTDISCALIGISRKIFDDEIAMY